MYANFATRLSFSLPLGLLFTSLLFLAMVALIEMADVEVDPITTVDTSAIFEEPAPITEEPNILKPDEPVVEQAPELPKAVFEPLEVMPGEGIEYIGNDRPENDIGAPMDGAAVELVQVRAEYPPRALSKGIVGFAVVGFSIDPSGKVVDPYIISSEPNSIFNRSALKAISRSKFKPKMVDGQAVLSSGHRKKFSFNLDK